MIFLKWLLVSLNFVMAAFFAMVTLSSGKEDSVKVRVVLVLVALLAFCTAFYMIGAVN